MEEASGEKKKGGRKERFALEVRKESKRRNGSKSLMQYREILTVSNMISPVDI